MNALDKAIEDLQEVVKAYALGKVDELAFVLPANAVLAAYAAHREEKKPTEWQCRFAFPDGSVTGWTPSYQSQDRAIEVCVMHINNGCQAWIRPMYAGDAWEVK